MWPDYALRAIAAFAVTIGVIIAMAATLKINPIEEYGPYYDWTVPNPATPDWYAGFLDGALRLGPAVEFSIFGHPIPALFWPGIVMPGIVVMVLFAWPWIDARLTHDTQSHDVLVPASRAPWRTGAGVAFIVAGFVLTLAASDDQQALMLHVPLDALLTFYRVLLPVGSIGAGLLAATFAREIAKRRDESNGESEPERVVGYRRNAKGGFDSEAVGDGVASNGASDVSAEPVGSGA
jgi:ubiquinol-cytochrome c reductase cytochrome b subunit